MTSRVAGCTVCNSCKQGNAHLPRSRANCSAFFRAFGGVSSAPRPALPARLSGALVSPGTAAHTLFPYHPLPRAKNLSSEDNG